MLIITADDYGKTKVATDSILECFSKKRVTAASVMVFMEDSERAASVAADITLELGLHLNFTEPFAGSNAAPNLRYHQVKTISYLSKNKITQCLYNPFLSESFKILFQAQVEEFERLYGKPPCFYNGHHHMHLCSNILFDNIIPKGSCVRNTFSFGTREKNPLNLLYRHFLKTLVSRKFVSTDSFFSIQPLHNVDRLLSIVSLSRKGNVELEVHPEDPQELNFILSDQFQKIIADSHLGCFAMIREN